MRKVSPRRVAIIYPASVPWFASCVDGIRRYASEHGGWSLFLSPPTLRGAEESEFTLHTMRDWKGDAIIAASNDKAELAAARKWGIPIVNLAAGLSKFPGIPRVMVDHFQAGGLAAEHLLKRGLRHLAYFGWKDVWGQSGCPVQHHRDCRACRSLKKNARNALPDKSRMFTP